MYLRIRRVVDVMGAAFGLIVAAPVMLVIALAIRGAIGRPILFRQRRPGLHERGIVCLKFRTMTEARDQNGRLLPDEERLTPLGSFLRRTSLDELPQLWNILRGDLSFIGPRPLLEHYLPYYTPAEHRRHSVRPGLTGWAQIHGRNRLSFDQRLAMDVWYVEHVSWFLDVKILLVTFWVVLTQRGFAMDKISLDEQRGGVSGSFGQEVRQ